MIVDKPLGLLQLESRHTKLFMNVQTLENTISGASTTQYSMTTSQFESRKEVIEKLVIERDFVASLKNNAACFTCEKRNDCVAACPKLEPKI